MLTPKVEINFFELLILFKVSFIFGDSLKYKKSANVIYSRNADNHNKYYVENQKIIEILWILL